MPKPVMLPPLPSHIRAEDIALALLQPKSPDQIPVEKSVADNGHDHRSHLVDGVKLPKVVTG